MIRWLFLACAIAAMVSVWGMVPGLVLFVAFLVLFANFASFCLLYDQPLERARLRIKEQLRHMNPNTDVAQRLQTADVKPTAGDRKIGLGPMMLLNIGSGLAAIGLLGTGVFLRIV